MNEVPHAVDDEVGGATGTRWWLVRHAPIVPEKRGTIVGRTDAPAGLPIEAATPRRLLPETALWFVSPALRAAQTAAALGATSWATEPDLQEQDFGAWEGKTWAELLRTESLAGRYLEAYDRVRPPRGECLEDVRARVRPVLARLASELSARDVIVVTHAGPIRCLVCDVLGIPLGSALKLSIDHLSVTLLEGQAGAWQVRGVNWGGRPAALPDVPARV